MPLAGLESPDDDSRDIEAAAAFDAVRLFDDRARRAQRGFELSVHLQAVLDIIDAVGGLPLAIEFAAGWLRLLKPGEIARDLRHLSSTSISLPPPLSCSARQRGSMGSLASLTDTSSRCASRWTSASRLSRS
jgi:hypothetical protein